MAFSNSVYWAPWEVFWLGYLLPEHRTLDFEKENRLKKFEKQLPEALGLMARSLKAGHSFPSSHPIGGR